MKRSRYETITDGDGLTIKNREVFKLACCDCGLVHDVVVVAGGIRKGKDIGLAMRRNKRATSQRRRHINK